MVSNAELVLLSLLKEKSRHAYEIEQVIEERNLRDWTEIGFSSIYRLLTKLEKNGWISGEMQPPEGRGPARKVYHLSPAGEGTWQQAALENLAHPDRTYSPFLLGLDNLCALPPEQALQAMRIYLADQQAIRQSLSLAVDQHPLKDDFFIHLFFDYLLSQMAGEIEWLQEHIPQLQAHYRNNASKQKEE